MRRRQRRRCRRRRRRRVQSSGSGSGKGEWRGWEGLVDWADVNSGRGREKKKICPTPAQAGFRRDEAKKTCQACVI